MTHPTIHTDPASMTGADLNIAVDMEVYGDDLKIRGDADIARGAGDWMNEGSDEAESAAIAWPGDGEIATWAWQHRYGKPWQSAIESHVANWRRPARNFCGDGGMMLALMEKMASLGLFINIIPHCKEKKYSVFLDGPTSDSDEIVANSIQEIPRYMAIASIRAIRASGSAKNDEAGEGR